MPARNPLPFLERPALRDLRRRLRRWYGTARRDLPWRGTRESYPVLVSEFMLQQTQVATVLPYFETFMRRFPTLGSLARASEEEVRAAWTGLGYYRRARDLQSAARTLVADHGGRLPRSLEALRALPGVGPYTAAALASIVHEVPTGVVDGNVIRVLTRLAADGRSPARAVTRRDLQSLADALVDPAAPGDWNQAMMELGASLCTPSRPRCPACPWETHCLARARGNPGRYPHRSPATTPVDVEHALGVFRRGRRVLLVRRRDPRLLDGTWEFPGVEVPGRSGARSALARSLEAWLGREVEVGPELARARHAITHRRLLLRAYSARAHPLPRAHPATRRWVALDETEALPLSSMTLKLMKALEPPTASRP